MSPIASKIVPLPRCHARLVASGYVLRWWEPLSQSGYVTHYRDEATGAERLVLHGRVGVPDAEFVDTKVGEVSP